MREVAGSTPDLDFCLLCEPICVSLRLFHCTLYKQLVFDHTLMQKGSVGQLVFDHTLMQKGSVGLSCRAIGSKIL
jgi:hypothetical protein